MAYGVRHKYIDFNTARDAEKPKGQGNTKKQKIRVLTPDEINALIDAESDLKYKILFQLAIFSGARQGEIIGLKWSDIDWKNSQIHIQRTFNNNAWYDTKTDTSDRKIDLGPAMMTSLKKWKLACPTRELNLVFPNKAENPINHNNLVNRHFNPEGCSFSHVALDSDVPCYLLDDTKYGGQPQPGPRNLWRIAPLDAMEFFEQPHLVFERNADARIGDADDYPGAGAILAQR